MLLALGAQRIAGDASAPPGTREAAAALRSGADAAIADLRRVVNGVMPALLIERGLYAAAEDLVDRIPIPTDLDLRGSDRSLPTPVESTAYFVMAEAIANAVKHSRARELAVRLEQAGGCLSLEVRDDGIGGAVRNGSTGLRGITDRVDGLGGRLVVESPPGEGTRLLVEMPCGS